MKEQKKKFLMAVYISNTKTRRAGARKNPALYMPVKGFQNNRSSGKIQGGNTMIKYYIALLCKNDYGAKVVQIYENNGATVGQFPEGSPKIPENCLMFSDESSFWLEMARNAPNNEARYACFRRAEKAKLLEIQKRR